MIEIVVELIDGTQNYFNRIFQQQITSIQIYSN